MPPPHRPDSAGSTRQRRTGVGGDSGSDTHSASTKRGTYCGSLHTRDKASRQGPRDAHREGTTRSTMPATEDGLRDAADQRNDQIDDAPRPKMVYEAATNGTNGDSSQHNQKRRRRDQRGGSPTSDGTARPQAGASEGRTTAPGNEGR